jgi:hypothetical protein
MESSFIIAVSLGVAFVMVFFVLVAIIVYQRWRISDNNAHLEKFINENIEMRRKLRKAGIYAVAALNIMLLSCSKAEDMEGMNDMRAFYSYKAFSKDFDYQVAEGPFDTAIRFSVGMDPIQGGNDDKVIEACDKCYEELKPGLRGRTGKVEIRKTRHPDGKQVTLKEYHFKRN